MKKSFEMQLGKLLLKEFGEIEPTLKDTGLYTAQDVARMCKLAANVRHFKLLFEKMKNPTVEERRVAQDVLNIEEIMDASLMGRVPFQAVMPEEMERDN